jgi:hypothetical protein
LEAEPRCRSSEIQHTHTLLGIWPSTKELRRRNGVFHAGVKRLAVRGGRGQAANGANYSTGLVASMTWVNCPHSSCPRVLTGARLPRSDAGLAISPFASTEYLTRRCASQEGEIARLPGYRRQVSSGSTSERRRSRRDRSQSPATHPGTPCAATCAPIPFATECSVNNCVASASVIDCKPCKADQNRSVN